MRTLGFVLLLLGLACVPFTVIRGIPIIQAARGNPDVWQSHEGSLWIGQVGWCILLIAIGLTLVRRKGKRQPDADALHSAHPAMGSVPAPASPGPPVQRGGKFSILGLTAIVLGILGAVLSRVPFYGSAAGLVAAAGLVIGVLGLLVARMGRIAGIRLPLVGCVVCIISLGLALAMAVRSERQASALTSPVAMPSERPYLERRSAFHTHLLHPGPSPQAWREETLPAGVLRVVYDSAGMKLKAWLWAPAGPSDVKHRALVYFHGGFAFGAEDLGVCKPFMDAGYVVMCPMLRGENGNPGNYELCFGEVDDAASA